VEGVRAKIYQLAKRHGGLLKAANLTASGLSFKQIRCLVEGGD
jgi:hypothetical protein